MVFRALSAVAGLAKFLFEPGGFVSCLLNNAVYPFVNLSIYH